MECVVCFEKFVPELGPICLDSSCRGGSAVCAPCSKMIDKCVYCREPRGGGTPNDLEKIFMRMYVALYYSSVIGYMLGHVDVSSDSDSASDSESEASAGGLLHVFPQS